MGLKFVFHIPPVSQALPALRHDLRPSAHVHGGSSPLFLKPFSLFFLSLFPFLYVAAFVSCYYWIYSGSLHRPVNTSPLSMSTEYLSCSWVFSHHCQNCSGSSLGKWASAEDQQFLKFITPWANKLFNDSLLLWPLIKERKLLYGEKMEAIKYLKYSVIVEMGLVCTNDCFDVRRRMMFVKCKFSLKEMYLH